MVETFIGNFDGKDLKYAISKGREVSDPKRLYIDFCGKKLQFIIRKHIGESTINVVVHQIEVDESDVGDICHEDLVPQINGHNFCININRYEDNNRRLTTAHDVLGYRDSHGGSCVSCVF
jgi:hypothetical protein